MWKTQLTIAINFVYFKNNDEEHVMHSKSDDKEININDKTDEVIEKIFKFLLNRYQNKLETSMGGSDFILDCAHLWYYKYHKINFKRGESYINTPD